VPGLVQLLRLPGLNMFSHNRLVFATAFSLLALAVVGMDLLWQEPPAWQQWFWLPAAILGILLLWCLYRTANLPEPIASQLPPEDPIWVARAQLGFAQSYLAGAVLSALALTGWLLLYRFSRPRLWFAPVLGGLLVADLLWFGHGIAPQCDPDLYYPPVPVLARLSEAPPGRVLGMACLPPVLNQTHHLHDVRDYDAVDPACLIDLLTIARDKNYPDSPAYAATQYYIPKVRFTPDGAIEAPPVMNMLNVRYFIFRGSPEPFIKPMLQDFDYWVLENKEALPRRHAARRNQRHDDDDDAPPPPRPPPAVFF
jgi:hypothetical protein